MEYIVKPEDKICENCKFNHLNFFKDEPCKDCYPEGPEEDMSNFQYKLK